MEPVAEELNGLAAGKIISGSVLEQALETVNNIFPNEEQDLPGDALYLQQISLTIEALSQLRKILAFFLMIDIEGTSLSQRTLAARIDTTPSTLQRWKHQGADLIG